jgi:hypothetical protein
LGLQRLCINVASLCQGFGVLSKALRESIFTSRTYV